MAEIFFPSCKAKAAFPKSSQKLAAYIKRRYNVDPIGCCKLNNSKLTKDDTAIILCLNCARVISANAEYKNIQYLWEIIDQDADFIFPDYQGQQMALQDCHLAKGQKNVQDAVRSLMTKMNIQIVELEKKRDNADHCASYEIVGYHRERPLTEEEQRVYFYNRYQDVEADWIVSYCKYCNDGVNLSGKKGKHILELLFPEE